MRKLLFNIAILAALVGLAEAPKAVKSSAWIASEPLGLRQSTGIDTLTLDYAQRSVPSWVSPAYATTGNLGCEGLDMVWLTRRSGSPFMFNDALMHWLPCGSPQKFYNTARPMTLLSYNAGGGRQTAQDRLTAVFSGNINKRAQIGANLDYIYSKGSYDCQASNDISWGVNGSYIGDRYELQAYFNQWNFLNKENGGITDALYITNPAKVQGGQSSVDAKSIPVNLTAAHTRVTGRELMLNNRYKIGTYHTIDTTQVTLKGADGQDSIVTRINREYIPVTSFIWTLNYQSGRHMFRSTDAAQNLKFFDHTYMDRTGTVDRASWWALTNTLGVDLLEGYNPKIKFGLAAYATHQIRRFTQPVDTLVDRSLPLPDGIDPLPDGFKPFDRNTTENLLWAGAQLTKNTGRAITFHSDARFGVAGAVAGDIRVEGSIDTHFRLLSDTLGLSAYCRFANEEPSFFHKRYISNHFAWNNDFGKERSLRIGGVISLDRTATRIEAAVENLQNRVYFGADGLPVQHGSNVQVISAMLTQPLRLGILHWDNTVIFQTSTDQMVIPLPKLALRSNLYLLFKVAKVLDVQFGVDCDYNTRYYAPVYQPATMSFCNQRHTPTGNYPFMNLYANMKLGRARFYVMMSHINQGIIGGKDYFSMPLYPLNPRRFQLGVSVDFAN